MLKSLFILSITLLVFTGCKKDDPIVFYPKTYVQTHFEHSYVFKVHDLLVSNPPPFAEFFPQAFLEYEFAEKSFTLLNEDTLYENSRDIHYAYVLRNDTLFIKKDLNQRDLFPNIVLIPYAYGNRSQFFMLDNYFAYIPINKQEGPFYEWPYHIRPDFSYTDYSFFTDTAAVLTIKRMLN